MNKKKLSSKASAKKKGNRQMPLYLTEQDEKNLKNCKVILKTTTDGGTIKEALSVTPVLINKIQNLEAENLHYQGLYNRLRNSLLNKFTADENLSEALQQCVKNQTFKPQSKKAPLRQTSILDNHEEQD